MEKILETFEYPELLLKEYKNWYLLLRSEQVTIGSLVLIEKSFSSKLSNVPEKSFIEFGDIVKEIENVLDKLFSYSKINYLMLMMRDKEVHYHIIPRYPASVLFNEFEFLDSGWPKFPEMISINNVDKITKQKLLCLIKNELTN